MLLVAVPVAVIAAAPLARWHTARRRRRIAARGLPPSAVVLLERSVPLYRRLPADLRARLDADIAVFLAEKKFYGQQGLALTDTMRLAVAAQACLLQLNQPVKFYPGFTSILIYPDTYVAVETTHDGLVETTHEHERAGESWYRGPVILSWADIADDLRHGGDGHNVVLHEFAHKLDEQDGLVDGAPDLGAAAQRAWAAVFMREFARLEDAVARGEDTLFDDYATTAPAEFFAVAVEVFCERGAELERFHAELYAELRRYFGLDPARWPAAGARRATRPHPARDGLPRHAQTRENRP